MLKSFQAIFAGIFLLAISAGAVPLAPQGVVLQGTILTPAGLPEEASSVAFTIQIRTNDINDCLLYSEAHTLNMNNSGGAFSLVMGSGTRSGVGFQSTSTLAQVFNNAATVITPLTCSSGTSYTPASGDSRKVMITFDDGSGPQTLTQTLTVQAVPYALYADSAADATSVGGKTAADFVQVNTSSGKVLSQANLETVFGSSANMTELMALINGTSTSFAGGSSATYTGSVTTNGGLFGSSSASGNLSIDSTSNPTKGNVIIAPSGGRVGIGTSTPVSTAPLTVNGAIAVSGVGVVIGDTSGNTRSSTSLDIQSSRSGATQVASGPGSVAVGRSNIASGMDSVALGVSNTSASSAAFSWPSTAVGFNNIANTSYATALGYSNTATTGDGTTAVGYNNLARYHNATALGYSNTAGGVGANTGASAVGYINSATGTNSSAFGNSNSVSATGASAFGNSITNATANSTMIGPSDAAKVTILSSGNVGIGTTTPFAKLEVAGQIATAAAGGLIIDTPNSSTENILFRNRTDGWNAASIAVTKTTGSNDNGTMLLKTTGHSVDQLFLDTLGNVGIGTASPSTQLHVKLPSGQVNSIFESNCSGCGSYINVFNAASIVGNSNAGIRFSTTSTGNIYGAITGIPVTVSNGVLNFSTNTGGALTEKMRIDQNGYVGIGSTSPTATLDVTGSAGIVYRRSGASSAISLTDYSGSQPTITMNGTDSSVPNNLATAGAFRIYSGSTNIASVNAKLAIATDTAGNVGIGTTAPQTKLDVNGTVRVAKYSAQPFACDAAHDSTLAITSLYRQCICNGGTSTWVFTSDGVTTCAWM